MVKPSDIKVVKEDVDIDELKDRPDGIGMQARMRPLGMAVLEYVNHEESAIGQKHAAAGLAGFLASIIVAHADRFVREDREEAIAFILGFMSDFIKASKSSRDN